MTSVHGILLVSLAGALLQYTYTCDKPSSCVTCFSLHAMSPHLVSCNPHCM